MVASGLLNGSVDDRAVLNSIPESEPKTMPTSLETFPTERTLEEIWNAELTTSGSKCHYKTNNLPEEGNCQQQVRF